MVSVVEPALRAAGVIGTWETDIPAGLSTLDKGAAGLLAGDIALAGQPIPLEVALSCTHADDRPWVFERIRRARQTGGPFSAEFRIVTETGDVRWVLNRGSIGLDEAGRMRGRGAYIDTTDSHHGPFLPAELVALTGVDPLTLAADRYLEAHAALALTDQQQLLRLSSILLMEIGSRLARGRLEVPALG